MQRIDLVEKLAELQRQYADAHRRVRSPDQYRVRHARRHPELCRRPPSVMRARGNTAGLATN